MAQYTKEQYWTIYEKLPRELKEAVFSAEVAEHIATTCERNNAQEMSRVASAVGDVLMGITLPANFQQALQKQVGLQPAVAQSIAQELSRTVFYPVKAQLEEIHRAPGQETGQAADIGVATPRHAGPQRRATQTDYLVQEEPKQPETPEEPIVEEPKPKQTDPYREASE